MVNTGTVQDRGNPGFGTILSREGYFRRVDEDSNLEMRRKLANSRRYRKINKRTMAPQ